MSEAVQNEYKAEITTNVSTMLHVAEEKFIAEKISKDPADQIAWNTSKRIEPRYSNANRRLAK